MTTKRCNHTSVGIIVRDGSRLLLIERKKEPPGFAAIAGHVESGESFVDAGFRELTEEVGLEAMSLRLVLHQTFQNQCRRVDGTWHEWRVYIAVVSTTQVTASDDETKSYRWVNVGPELNRLAERTERYRHGDISDHRWRAQPGLEPVWYDIFRELGIISVSA